MLSSFPHYSYAIPSAADFSATPEDSGVRHGALPVKARPCYHDGTDVSDVHGFVAVGTRDIGSLARLGQIVGVQLHLDMVEDVC